MTPLDGDARPLSKDAQLARGPKKYRRDVAGGKRWQQIANAKTGPCRVCGAPPQMTTFHHIVPRGSPYFGSDTEANIAPLCGTGTTGCHGLIEARDQATARVFVARLSDAEYSYAVHRGGEGFWERRYGIVYDRAASAALPAALAAGGDTP